MAKGRLKVLCEPAGAHATTAYLAALSRSFGRAGLPQVNLRRFKPVRDLLRLLGKLRVQRNLMRLPRWAFVVPMAWPNDGRAFPFAYLWEIIPYISDCWPHDYVKWESMFRRNRVRIAFFSARGSADFFKARRPEMSSYWVPEACDPSEYQPDRPLIEREIDVLELGRNYGRYHEKIEDPIPRLGYRLLYSQDGTRTLIFPDQPSLISGLGNTKISISFPRSVTHPEAWDGAEHGSGGLETVTLRYFEAFASKCIVVGQCPAELQEIFGYNPVIEADLEDPVGQLQHILSSVGDYQELVDKNRRRLMEVGTWDKRVEAILSILSEHGWYARQTVEPQQGTVITRR